MAEVDLKTKFPAMTPVKSAPALYKLNGCGVGLYGKRDSDAQTGTYISTWCFSLLFVPVFCLRAYRVADAQRGWYFLGREPLSRLAKGWNAVVLAAVVAIVGTIQINAYVSSPAYKAKQQITAARSFAAGGQLGRAAQIYQTLALSGADQADTATAAVKDLVDNQCPEAPLAESAAVFSCATRVAGRGSGISLSELAAAGLKLVDDKGGSDPKSAILLLEVIRPLFTDTRPVDDRQFALLGKWSEREPSNLEVIVPLASQYEKRERLDKAKDLLFPVKDKLGDGEGARVLGTILGREGDFDGAYALLWPYVKLRLDRLHAAESTSEATVSRLWDREFGLLRDDKAPADFYAKYKDASPDLQRTLVAQYVNSRLRNDPEYTGAQEALERETAVVPVALELGIVMLQRAQGLTDPDLRKKQLESAEKVFLAVGGIAGKSDEYRLSLGQVYYWLGRQAEGRKLFDDYLTDKARAFPDLINIAARLRQLGADPDVRLLAEEAYSKASSSEERYEAAAIRATSYKDLDDQIAWLYKSDVGSPSGKASLAKANGLKAFEEGRDDEAVSQFRSAVDAYNGMPRNANTLNETALAYYSIFQATGDHQALERCSDFFQQAVDLDPKDSILLFNAGVTILEGAVADIIGTDIDLHALHESAGLSLLGFFYRDEKGRQDLVLRVKNHPGVMRALSYLEKVMVLSPKSGRAYAPAYEIHAFTRNQTALDDLERRLRAADLDTSAQLDAKREFLTGVKDQQRKLAVNALIKRGEDRMAQLRAKGGRTAAVALDQQAEVLMAMDMFGDAVDSQRPLALAQEAFDLAPSSSTSAALSAAYLFRGTSDLRKADQEIDAYFKKYNRTVGPSYVLAALVSGPDPMGQKILQNPDVQKGIALMREDARRTPDVYSVYQWALLKNTDKQFHEEVAQSIRESPLQRVKRSIETLLDPAGTTEAIENYWYLQICGKPDEARSALRKVTDLGLPLPIAP